ncbi:MAG: hypothetical protein Kow0090_03880 [Myxococcota bacterium]
MEGEPVGDDDDVDDDDASDDDDVTDDDDDVTDDDTADDDDVTDDDDDVADDDDDDDDDTVTLYTCQECHTSKAAIKADIARRPSDHVVEGGGGGCGGAISRFEPSQAVFVNQTFLSSMHGSQSCVSCHGGVEPAANRDDAHTGDFVVYAANEKNCGGCHKKDMEKYPLSLHAKFNGLTPEDEEFVKRAAAHVRRVSDDKEAQKLMAQGIEQGCAECHRTTCGACHITLPKPSGGGFPNTGHVFYSPPNVVYNCTACHGGRKAKEFLVSGVDQPSLDNCDLGTLEELKQDVHYNPGEMSCEACHPYDWMHAPKEDMTKKLRYENEALPKCEECHVEGNENQFFENSYHATHAQGKGAAAYLSCQVCHSQPYPNCISCHLKPGEEGEPPADYKFFTLKIAKNPFQTSYYAENIPRLQERYTYDYTLVRRPSIVPDTFDGFGKDILSNYTKYSTWKYATPHNIQLQTMQTKNGCEGCHNEKKFYLTREYLQNLMTPEHFGEKAGLFLEKELEANSEILMEK